MRKETIAVAKGSFSVHLLKPSSEIPKSVLGSSVYAISNTYEGITIVCDSSIGIESLSTDIGWSCLTHLLQCAVFSTGVRVCKVLITREVGLEMSGFRREM